jgi:hypothetical protein
MSEKKKRILWLIHDTAGWAVIVYCWLLMIDHSMIAVRQQKHLLEGLATLAFPGVASIAISLYLDMARMVLNKSRTVVK